MWKWIYSVTLDGDVNDVVLKEEYEYVSSGDQLLNHVDGGTPKIELDTLASTSVLLPQALSVDCVFQGVIK